MKKKLFIVAVFFLLATVTALAYSWTVRIDESYDYLSKDLYERAHQLQERYPDIVRVVEYGRSLDNKPLFAVQMSKDVQTYMESEEVNTERTHYYIDGGNHARETVNPPMVLRMVEDYARDYYENGFISEFSLSSILQESVLHFVPLPNPDGFDLAKKGYSSIQTEKGRVAIQTVNSTRYSYFKAGLSGVDHNRNYPVLVYDFDRKIWEDIRGKYPSWLDTNVPSEGYYGGPKAASEPEVAANMEYLLQYDFRQYLTFHSRGNLTYWHKYFYPKAYNDQTRRLAEIVRSVNGYTVAGLSNGRGSGYLSDFTAAMTFKPTVTVETTSSLSVLPTIQSKYAGVYSEIRHLPLHLREEGERTGYHDYKLYRDGIYVRDFLLKDYAEAKANKFGGYVLEYTGAPKHIDPTLLIPDPEPDFPAEDYRIFGSNRYRTAEAIALKAYEQASRVILVRGDSIEGAPQVTDALSASGLAGAMKTPILLTPQNRLPDSVIETLRTLETEEIIIVGGENAVGAEVAAALEELGLEVSRIEGANRYATSLAVAKALLEVQAAEEAEEGAEADTGAGTEDDTAEDTAPGTEDDTAEDTAPGTDDDTAADSASGTEDNTAPDTIIITGGHALVDSLVAGPLSHREGYPIILVRDRVGEDFKNFLEEQGIKNVLIVGGSSVVSEEVEGELKGLVEGSVERISGLNRYSTSHAMAARYFNENPEILLVNGTSFVDAVAGSIFEKPILYTRADSLDKETRELLLQKKHFHLLGGQGVITNRLMIEAYDIIN